MSTEVITADVSSTSNDVSSSAAEIIEQPKNDMTPKRTTTSLELLPEQVEKVDIARKQLENLSKKPRKTSPSDNENANTSKDPEELQESVSVVATIAEEIKSSPPVSEVLYSGKPTMSNLSSAIISKEELEYEIRKKVGKPKIPTNTIVGEIEIPQELILSELSVPITSTNENELTTATVVTSSTSQLDGQELIDILEGKSEDDNEGEIFEVYGENGMFIVKDKSASDNQVQTTSYEIISTEDETMKTTKQKLLEREIAMRQIASMPTRKNRKLKQTPPSSAQKQQQPTLAQSLAMDWNDDKEEEVILELENVEESNGESKIKILNMTIINEDEMKLKPSTATQKVEMPKILNKNAPKQNVKPPKILNINAPQTSTASTSTNIDDTPRRGRLIKKKTIWDPSEAITSTPVATTTTTVTAAPPSTSSVITIEKKPVQNKLPIALPSTITIKKLTKESITKSAAAKAASASLLPSTTLTVVDPHHLTPGAVRKGKKKSEIDRLFQDEGAVNMIYSLERRNNNQDVPEIKVNVDQQSFVDKVEEKSTLLAKTKTIKQTIIKQSVSPPEIKTTPMRPQRVKRDLTPNKQEGEPAEKKATQEKTEKTVIVTKAQKTTPAAARKKKTDDSWDFMRKAQTTCDDAMIIRRHSSSSYSSSATSPRRLSLDQSIADFEENNGFKFMKPQEKKTPELQQKDLKTCVGGLVEELRNTLSNKLSKGKIQAEKTVKGKKRTAATTQESPPPAKRSSDRRTYGNDKEYQLTKSEGVAHLTLTSNPLTISFLSEVKTILNQLETDDECKTVLVTASESFSKGLDYSTLLQTTVDKRKQAASDLVTAVK